MSEADDLLRRRASTTLGWAPEQLDGRTMPVRTSPSRSDRQDRVRLLKLSDVQEEPVRWLWPHRLPRGKLAILEGHPGLGKSTLATDVIAAVTGGGSIAGHRLARPEHVVWMSYEDARADTLKPRLLAAGGDPSRVHLPELQLPEGLAIGLELPTHILDLERELQEKGVQPALVVIDPLAEALSASVDSHREQEVRRALAALTDFAARNDTCVLLIRHLRKQATGRAITSGGGSIGFAAAARVVLRIDEDPDRPELRLLSTVKNNLAPKDPTISFELAQGRERSVATVRWKGEVDWSADELDGRDCLGRSGQSSEVRAWLETLLSRGPRHSREVHSEGREEGFSKNAIERAATALGIRRRQKGVGGKKRSLWSLPKSPSVHGQESASEPGQPRPAEGRESRQGQKLDPGASGSANHPSSPDSPSSRSGHDGPNQPSSDLSAAFSNQ